MYPSEEKLENLFNEFENAYPNETLVSFVEDIIVYFVCLDNPDFEEPEIRWVQACLWDSKINDYVLLEPDDSEELFDLAAKYSTKIYEIAKLYDIETDSNYPIFEENKKEE